MRDEGLPRCSGYQYTLEEVSKDNAIDLCEEKEIKKIREIRFAGKEELEPEEDRASGDKSVGGRGNSGSGQRAFPSRGLLRW